MSYVYVRLDIKSTVPNPASQSLLKHFVSSLYDPDVIGQCSVYGFTPVPTRVRDIAMAGLEKLQLDPSAPTWTVETNTIKGGGQGDYVISGKRRSYVELQSSGFESDITSLSEELLVNEEEDLEFQTSIFGDDTNVFTLSEANAIKASLVMGALSIVLWILTILFLIVKKLAPCC